MCAQDNMKLVAWMRFVKSTGGVAVALAVVVALGLVAWLWTRRERFDDYHDCKDKLCGGTGECGQCKEGGWRTAGDNDEGNGNKGRDKKGKGKKGKGKKDNGGGDEGDKGGGGGDEGKGWRKARITCYAPTNRFSEKGGKSDDMVAVHEKDRAAYAGKRLEIKWPGGATKRLRVGDYCADKDCDNCCTDNANDGGDGFLLDVNKDSLPSSGVDGDACWAVGKFRVV